MGKCVGGNVNGLELLEIWHQVKQPDGDTPRETEPDHVSRFQKADSYCRLGWLYLYCGILYGTSACTKTLTFYENSIAREF